jgi:hypothetical protein
MATQKQPKGKVASNRPDNMVLGGLPGNFDGVITKARTVSWNYPNRPDLDPQCAGHIVITPDDPTFNDGNPVEDFLTAAKVKDWLPSQDGENPVDLESSDPEDREGIYFLSIGSQEALNKNSKWAEFLGHLHDAGMSYDDMLANVDFLEGLHAHFDRVPQKKRDGMPEQQPEEGKKKFEKMILVPTKLLDAVAKGGKGKVAAKPAPSPGAAADSGGDDDEIIQIVVNALTAAKDNVLGKMKLPGEVVKNYKGKDKQAKMKYVTSTEFLESEALVGAGVIFDADAGTVTLVS